MTALGRSPWRFFYGPTGLMRRFTVWRARVADDRFGPVFLSFGYSQSCRGS